MLELSGSVHVLVRDADTLEIINEIEQKNVITYTMYNSWITGGIITGSILLSTSTSPHYEDWAYVPNCITDGYIPAGVTSPRLVAASGNVPAYIELAHRFNAPAITRSINTIGIANNSFSGSTGPGSINRVMAAYVTLSAPCVQTNTQILDVYYRVQATSTNSYNYNLYNITPTITLNSLFSTNGVSATAKLPNSSSVFPFWTHVTAISNTTPTADGALWHEFGNTNAISTSSTIDSTLNKYGQLTINWNWATTQGVGALIGSMCASYLYAANTIRHAMSTINITAPNNSAIQPIFSHNASTKTLVTATPFLDSSPASGSGSLSLGGTWTGGKFPELYKIDITTSGNVGTAQYTVKKRYHFGFGAAGYHSSAHGLPGLYYASATFNAPHTGLPGDSAVKTRIEAYDTTTLISYDSTGVSKYNCVTQLKTVWDANTTPPLAATNITQVAVNKSDGSIWVACAATGVYKIDSAGTTITNFTTANGLPSNNCYALDIGRNNAVWVVCAGGVASSTNGTAWTVYNTGSSPAFNNTILNTDWSSVSYMRVDPTHVDDRLCIVRKTGTALNTTTGLIWWSRATGTTINTTSMPTDSNFSYRDYPSALNVSDNDSFWALSTYPNAYCFAYGATTFPATPVVVSAGCCSVMFVRNSANTADLLLRLSTPNLGTAISSMGISVAASATAGKTISLYDKTGAQIATTTTPASGNYGANMAYSLAGTFDIGVYLGYGIMAGYRVGNASAFGTIYALSGNGTPAGGTGFEYLIWTNYGWDGTNWIEGSTTPKTTHAAHENLIEGLTINFTNGASGTSFIINDYYTGAVNYGILKNDAMTFSGSYTFNVMPTELVNTFDGVVRTYTWTTGTVAWRRASASLTINNDNSLVNGIPYRSSAIYAVSKNRVFGDFSISGTITPVSGIGSGFPLYLVGLVPNMRRVMGELAMATDALGFGPAIKVDSANITCYNNNVLIPGQISTTLASTPLTWTISRTGSTITIAIGGVTKATITNNSHSFAIGVHYLENTLGTYTIPVPAITVASSGTGYYTGIGDSGSGKGIYNNKFFYSNVVNTGDISLDGTPLTVLNKNSTSAPAPGGANLAAEEGLLLFNSADVGKTVTGSALANYQVTTPCNIIPV